MGLGVLIAKPVALKQSRSGLTVVLPWCQISLSASGKSSISAAVVKLGGPGVAIAPPLNYHRETCHDLATKLATSRR
jgi:hypothetical protein